MSKSINDMKIGETAEIAGFKDENVIVKLLEMGCLPGTEVYLKFMAPFKGPLYISVGGNEIALRRGVAKSILVKDIKQKK